MGEISKILLKRSIYSSNKIKLDFIMYEPSATYTDNGDSRTITTIAYPTLQLKPVRYGSTGFNIGLKINPKNLYYIVKFFSSVVEWFTDESMKDLYVINSDNELVFNADYRTLSATTPKGRFDTTSVKAIPSVIDTGMGAKQEGLVLYFNDVSNIVHLTTEELYSLYSVLKSFSFVEEMTYSLTCVKYLDDKRMIVPYTPQSQMWDK